MHLSRPTYFLIMSSMDPHQTLSICSSVASTQNQFLSPSIEENMSIIALSPPPPPGANQTRVKDREENVPKFFPISMSLLCPEGGTGAPNITTTSPLDTSSVMPVVHGLHTIRRRPVLNEMGADVGLQEQEGQRTKRPSWVFVGGS